MPTIDTTKPKPKKKKNFYYNEEEVQILIHEYQDTTIICASTGPSGGDSFSYKDLRLERKIVNEVEKIVDAIIMNYQYYRFEPYEDLKQHALLQCFTNFLKFNKEKGTSFNFFSLISKISLLNYTTRKKKHRNHQNVEDQLGLSSPDFFNFSFFIDGLEETLFSIVDKNFVGNKRTKYIKIASLLVDYLSKTEKFVSKSDLYSWCRSYGVKNSDVREFVKSISKHNTELFEGAS